MTTLALSGLSSVPRADGFAVRDVDLTVPHGSICVVLGPSGSGKTTLLRLVAGLDAVAAGTVRIGGDDVTGWPPARRNLAWLAQEHPLYPHLDVERNIGFALRLRRMATSEVDKRVRAEARAAGVASLLGRLPGTLSAGQQQAAGLARATARMPQAYLLDEPLARLDHVERSRLRAELAEFFRTLQAPAMVATNDQLEALTFGDELAVLRGGRVQQTGSPAALLARPGSVFVATFLGDHGMNVVPGVLEAGRFATWVRVGDEAVPLSGLPPRLRSELDGRPTLLGFRPDRVRLVGPAAGELTARVRHVERLGHATLVHARLSGGPAVVIRTAPGRPPRAGERVHLAVDTSDAHLFDHATEVARWHARGTG